MLPGMFHPLTVFAFCGLLLGGLLLVQNAWILIRWKATYRRPALRAFVNLVLASTIMFLVICTALTAIGREDATAGDVVSFISEISPLDIYEKSFAAWQKSRVAVP